MNPESNSTQSEGSSKATIGSIITTGIVITSALIPVFATSNPWFQLPQQVAVAAVETQQPTPIHSVKRVFSTPQARSNLSAATDTIAAVEAGSLKLFQDKTGVFSIQVPENWSLRDASQKGEAIVAWTDPDQNSMVGVAVFEHKAPLGSREVGGILQAYVQGIFESEQDVVINAPQQQPDGSTLMSGSYTSVLSNNVRIQMIFNSFIEQQGDKIGLITIALPATEVERLMPVLNQILQSYQLNPQAKMPAG